MQQLHENFLHKNFLHGNLAKDEDDILIEQSVIKLQSILHKIFCMNSLNENKAT